MSKKHYYPRCKNYLDNDWRFVCQICGAKLDIGMEKCPNCGNDLYERHCKKCGYLFAGKLGLIDRGD